MKNCLIFVFAMMFFSCNKEEVFFEEGSFAEAAYTNQSRVNALFESLNLDYPGLEKVKQAYQSQELDLAVEALFEYYKVSPAGESVREEEIVAININQPILDYLKDTYTYFGFRAKIPRDNDGHLDWKYTPNGTSQEFTHYLNRFVGLSHWVRAAYQTRNDTWIDFLNETLVDFIVSNPYRNDRLAQPLETECRGYEFGGSKNYPWLILNAGVRLRAFNKAFYNMMGNELMQPETFLLLLSSIEEHVDYMYTRGGFNGDNWDNINLSSLLKTATYFPEFKKSDEFKSAAADRYFNNLRKVWYKDGSQWELANHYGMVVLNNCFNFIDQLEETDVQVPDDILEMLNDQVLYMASTSDPDGYILPSNDSNPNELTSEKLRDLANRVNNQKALFIVSNGNEGTIPEGPSSRFFDYSGNLISRDNWENPTQFSWFDVGPFGMGHNHADKLSLNIYNGRKLLVDPGRFIYGSNDEWATYRKATNAHNTITIDGANQKMLSDNGAAGLPGAADDYLKNNSRSFLQLYDMARDTPVPPTEYEITDDYDYARGTVFAGYEGEEFSGQAIHERGVHYERGKYWVVLDRVFSDRNRQIEAFWHLHPDCKQVEIDASGRVITKDAGPGNIMIIPLEGNALPVGALVKGETAPQIQGWYSPEYNEWSPSYDAVFELAGEKMTYFGWLIIPFMGTSVPEATASIIENENHLFTIEVDIANLGKQYIEMRLSDQSGF